MGIEGVDTGLFEGRSHLQPSNEFEDLSKHSAKLRKKLKDRGLKPADIFLQTALDFVSLATNHPQKEKREKARDLFLKTLEYASICGAKHVTALPGVYFEGKSKDDSFKRCCEELAWLCEFAEKYGLLLSIEAHLGSIASNPKEAMNL